MQSILKKSAVLAAAFLIVGGTTARAESVEVNVAFPFVVGGVTLPAGHYVVETEGTSALLIRGEKGNRADKFVLAVPAVGHDPAGEKPVLTFTRHEKGYRLSGIWESATYGYTIVDR
jgi:hypothetical protein